MAGKIYNASEVTEVTPKVHGIGEVFEIGSEPKDTTPSTIESIKSGFMEKKLPAGASGWDKFMSFIGEESPSIAGGTVGAIKGAALGAPLGPVGVVAGGIVGGALGAGVARSAQEGVQQLAGTKESISESGMDIAKSAVEGAAGEALGPSLKLLGRGTSKVLGWTSGLGAGALDKIASNPEIVLSNIGKVTKYDVDDAARELATDTLSNLDPQKNKTLVDNIKLILKDKNPADMLTHILSKESKKDAAMAITPSEKALAEVTQGGTSYLSEHITENFLEKKIAYDATRLLNTAGIMDISSSPSAMLAAMGLLNMSLGTGLAGVAIKSPAIAGAGTAIATKATELVSKKLGKQGAALVGQTIAHSTEDDNKNTKE